MTRIYLFLFLSILLIKGINAQERAIHINVEAIGSYTSPGYIPFWLRSNQFGSIPLDNASMSFLGSIRKDYDVTSKKLFDWGGSIEGRVNVGNKTNFTLIEGFGTVSYTHLTLPTIL